MSNPAHTKVVTGKVRLSYCWLFEPRPQQGDTKPKYSTQILIPKSDTATVNRLRAAQQAALNMGKNTVFNGRIPPRWVDTLHDGDTEADLTRYPERRGHWYMDVSSTQRPGVVDRNMNSIFDSNEVYSGCYARVSVRAFPYSNTGKMGVSFRLNHVQKLADGEPLDGRTRAEDDFGVWDGGDEAGLL